ncbi:CaiB/BaiF CoA-transferase family protein [Variovorax sp. UMC13]|uniref:CaiB/BaiF CoA transferase family protein n=1 Tax=Variovorax sp. UMC13 TaxID=1862326 RepID=UPI001602C6C4|nr:CaiB/BaiF CoA-transferase family protein [Variovorax sp. UMC13]MBB1603777.1 CoA-transferase [Variovorax sp. UMC13]
MPLRPLDGVIVLALEHAVAAPLCTRHLADQGARVIKIERPGVGDFARHYDQRVRGQSSYFVWANRSKESLAFDIKHPRARTILERLLARTDVVVQNLAPGAAARLGMSFETLQATHPRLIVCDISGYGADGPYRDKKAYDLMVQAEAGLLSATGNGDAMARAGFSAADVSAGMYAYSSVLSALLLRARTDQGSHIDVAMFESLAEWMGNPMYYTFDGQPAAARTGGAHPSIAPYGPTRVGDGQTLMLGVQNEREWHRFCAEVLLDAALAEDPRFITNTLRSHNREALNARIAEVFASLDTTEVETRLARAQIAQSRVNAAADLWLHPQLKARGRWTEVHTPAGPVPALRPPATNSAFAARMDPVPAIGEHTDALLVELGFDGEEIAALHAEGAV